VAGTENHMRIALMVLFLVFRILNAWEANTFANLTKCYVHPLRIRDAERLVRLVTNSIVVACNLDPPTDS